MTHAVNRSGPAVGGMLFVIVSLMACAHTEYAPLRTAPPDSARVQLHAREPRIVVVETDGQLVRLSVKRVYGRLESMRGDTVRMGVDTAELSDGTTWSAGLPALATVVLDGSTQMLVQRVDLMSTTVSTTTVLLWVALVVAPLAVARLLFDW